MKTSYGIHNYIKFVKIPFFGQMLLSFMYFASILGQVMAPITSPPSSQRPLSRHRASSRFPSTTIHSRASSQDEEGTSKIGGMCVCLLLECILFLHFYDSTTKRLFMFLVFKIWYHNIIFGVKCENWTTKKNYRNTCIRLLFIKQNFGHIVRKRLNGNFVYIHLYVQMYSLALIYNSLISLYECISYTATLPSLRKRGYNSLQNMLLKLMIQMFTMPWCVLPNLFAHPIADTKLHLSKNNNIVLTKFTFEFFQLVTDNSVSWRLSLEAVNFWISRIPILWNRQHLSPILEVSFKFHGCQQTDKTIGTDCTNVLSLNSIGK